MSTAAILWLVLAVIAVVIIGAVFYYRKPDVQTPSAIKDVEDRLRARGRKLEDDARDKIRSKL